MTTARHPPHSSAKASLLARYALVLVAASGSVGCAGHHHQGAGREDPLVAVARAHGESGPWAVAGYRMGKFALTKLGIAPYSVDLEVTHRSPRAFRYTCIADGASAATGASVGKMNLAIEEATPEAVETVYRRRSTGQLIILRPSPSFAQRFAVVAKDQAAVLGRVVLGLRDDEIFTVVNR
jgi:formylmethanofuran dehydrogenase subunit E